MNRIRGAVVKKKRHHGKLVEHLVQPFSIPYPGEDRVYLSSGFCESDECTTIYKRSVVEGDSDVCPVECSVCGGPVITYKHSSEVTSTYSPGIVGCLIQKDQTLSFVVETSLSQYDFETVKDVILRHLERHDFTASFQRINVYHSGVNSLLLRKLPSKRSLLFTRKLKSISEETRKPQRKDEQLDPAQKAIQDKEDKRRRKELAASAKKLLKEHPDLFMLPGNVKSGTNLVLTPNFPKTSKPLREKLSKAERISLRKEMRDFAMTDTVYE
jgi:hypothetical protein